ncbi:MAG: hypothetical protein F6K37_27090 [Moorea sp. SIO4E2]|uniref:hypothetical protein n=1 Tax=Moorena sp. SIO4E2 TaxID=2607826 RepID=UPI0013BCD562|nr:hypothetical protein [Moorena sp. SIO4E2]NEQ09480.1 hypothetical protein [Moorena sp. SIO4E2]
MAKVERDGRASRFQRSRGLLAKVIRRCILLWNGDVGGMGMLVEWACWWNGDVGGMGILVEWACWWNGHVGVMGILVEWGCWWNGDVGGMGMLVEWASCPFHF